MSLKEDWFADPVEWEKFMTDFSTKSDTVKDELLRVMGEKIETMKKLNAAYRESIDTQTEMLMLKARDRQAVKEKIDRFNAELKKSLNHSDNLENQQLI